MACPVSRSRCRRSASSARTALRCLLSAYLAASAQVLVEVLQNFGLVLGNLGHGAGSATAVAALDDSMPKPITAAAKYDGDRRIGLHLDPWVGVRLLGLGSHLGGKSVFFGVAGLDDALAGNLAAAS